MNNTLEKISEVFLCHTSIVLPDGEHFTPTVYIPVDANDDTEILIKGFTITDLGYYGIYFDCSDRCDGSMCDGVCISNGYAVITCKKKDLNKAIEKFRELIEKGLKKINDNKNN